MKKLLLNIAFIGILCLTGTVYTTDIDIDDLNINPFSKIPNKLIYQICQDLPLEDINSLSRTNKNSYENINVEVFFHDRFCSQSYISLKLYNSEELKKLQKLTVNLHNDVEDKIKSRKHELEYIERFYLMKNGRKTADVRWRMNDMKIEDKNNGFILDVYKYNKNVLEFAKHNNMLIPISKLLGCSSDQVRHKKSDIIYDKYKEFRVSGTQVNRIAYNELGIYKQNFCLERNEVKPWQDNTSNSCHVNTMTLIGPDVIVDVWKDAMSKKSSKEAREFRKTHNPSESIILKFGDTIFLHSHTEVSFKPRDISSNRICILSNGFSCP